MLTEESGRLMDLREVEELLNSSASNLRNNSISVSLRPTPSKELGCFQEGELELMMAEDEDEVVVDRVVSSDIVKQSQTSEVVATDAVVATAAAPLASLEDNVAKTETVYIKNWLISVEKIPENDPVASILSPSLAIDYWIILLGNIVKTNDQSTPTKSKWILRVLTENCIQAVDGTIYTLLGGMDTISAGFSDSSFDTGIFENGFGSNDHEWKERVLQILGLDTTSSSTTLTIKEDGNELTITDRDRENIVQQDLWIGYKKEAADRPTASTDITDIVPELIHEPVQFPSLADVDADQTTPVQPLASSSTSTTTTLNNITLSTSTSTETIANLASLKKTAKTPTPAAPTSQKSTPAAHITKQPTPPAPISENATHSAPISQKPTPPAPISKKPTPPAPISQKPTPPAPISKKPTSPAPISKKPKKNAKKSTVPYVKKKPAVDEKKVANTSVSVKNTNPSFVNPKTLLEPRKAEKTVSDTSKSDKKKKSNRITTSSTDNIHSSAQTPHKRLHSVSFNDNNEINGIDSPPLKTRKMERSSPRFLQSNGSSPDILVSRSGRLSKKPSEWWIV